MLTTRQGPGVEDRVPVLQELPSRQPPGPGQEGWNSSEQGLAFVPRCLYFGNTIGAQRPKGMVTREHLGSFFYHGTET